jgi:hypothetical protein
MEGLGKFLDEWQAGHGAFTEEEMARARRDLSYEDPNERAGAGRGRADRDRLMPWRSRKSGATAGDGRPVWRGHSETSWWNQFLLKTGGGLESFSGRPG